MVTETETLTLTLNKFTYLDYVFLLPSYMHIDKRNLALNNPQMLICHKTQPNQGISFSLVESMDKYFIWNKNGFQKHHYKPSLIWNKAKSMRRQVRLELTNNGLLT